MAAYDEAALELALGSEAAYVALVASRRRAEAIGAYLRDAGIAEEHLARLKAPAGLDIGAVEPAEIALSIMAEIVQTRRQAGQGDRETRRAVAAGRGAERDRPGLRHDGRGRDGALHRRARGAALLLLLRRLQALVRAGAGEVPGTRWLNYGDSFYHQDTKSLSLCVFESSW